MRRFFAAMGCVAVLAAHAGQTTKAPDNTDASPPGNQAPYKSRAMPVYPGFEAVYGIEGTTILLILVHKDGSPIDIKVEQSSGWRELDRAATVAAIQWRFTPEIKNGVAVDGYVRVPVAYTDAFHESQPWPLAYQSASLEADETSIPYATVQEAIAGVAAMAHQPVYDGSGANYHEYVIYDDKKVMRERWYFTDILTKRAMAVRYTFAGTTDHPVTKVSALCDNATVCRDRMPTLMTGPYSIRKSN